MNVQSTTDHEERVARLINLRSWAVVGVSQDTRKYGHRVFIALLESGYHVLGVNPKGGSVAGHRVYPSLADLPERPEVVVTVVPPPVTEQIVATCGELGIMNVWMQPGSESETAIGAAQEHGMTVVAHDCAMVRRKQWRDAS
ncbi:MAG: CoA-binding protein [Chloroflexi bacterium]|nr:CoA-binding protein [Chloroflexota bacterium]